MKPNDKAIEAGFNACTTVSRSIVIDILTAAYAAQFPPSEDYAGLVKELRDAVDCHQCDEIGEKAADALEAVLAERDALKAVVEIYEKKLNGIEDEIRLETQSAIAAIRPHIEAAERERCAKAVITVAKKINVAPHERPAYEDGYLQGVHDAAAAIRSGK